MARSYRDAIELKVGPLPWPSAVLPPDTVALEGMVSWGDVAVPVTLTPGYEYRIRSFRNEEDRPGEHVRVIERRRVASAVTRREGNGNDHDDEDE